MRVLLTSLLYGGANHSGRFEQVSVPEKPEKSVVKSIPLCAKHQIFSFRYCVTSEKNFSQTEMAEIASIEKAKKGRGRGDFLKDKCFTIKQKKTSSKCWGIKKNCTSVL